MPAVQWTRAQLDQTATAEVAALARAALETLAQRSDPDAFAALLELAQAPGECLGVSARTLAEHGSWRLAYAVPAAISGLALVAGLLAPTGRLHGSHAGPREEGRVGESDPFRR